MRLINADALIPKIKYILEAEHQIYGKESWNFAEKCLFQIEDAPTIEPKTYEDVVKTIADASFTGGDGLDYVETLVALNAIKGMKRETGEWIPYTYVAPDDWYQDKEIRYRCSKCGVEVINKSNFCPNCGKDMHKDGR